MHLHKKAIQSRPNARLSPTRAAAIAILATWSASCGKVGPPVAPARLTARTDQLSAVQRGSAVVLSWPAPPLGGTEGTKFFIARVDIYRLTEQRDQEPILDPEDYEDLSELVGYLDRPSIEKEAQSLGRLEFADALKLTSPAEMSKVRVRYAIRYVNSRGQAASFSNSVAIEPIATVSSAPSGLRVSAPRQDAVELSWTAPESNVDGSKPSSVVGYNVYRRKANSPPRGQPLNDTPVPDTRFVDAKFDYRVDYVYSLRAVSQGANGLLESADSDAVAFTPVDSFPPAPPDPVSIASANGIISLFWPTSSERDVVGYNVYRAESADAPQSGWVKLNPRPSVPTTFRDERVVIDRTYFYRVTAVDRFENESAPARTVSETAHP